MENKAYKIALILGAVLAVAVAVFVIALDPFQFHGRAYPPS